MTLSPALPMRAPLLGDVRDATEIELWHRWCEDGDVRARDELTRRYLPLALRITADHVRRSSPRYDDARSAGLLGLAKAVERYTPDRGNSFAVYARLVIRGEILRHFRSTRYAVHVPRPHHERWMQLRRARRDAWVALGREPSSRDLAEHLGWDVALVEATEAVDAAERVATIEPDAPTHEGPDDTAQEAVRRTDVRAAVAKLEPRLQQLIARRYHDEAPQSELARDLGISQAHVSRLLARAHEQLRAELTVDDVVNAAPPMAA